MYNNLAYKPKVEEKSKKSIHIEQRPQKVSFRITLGEKILYSLFVGLMAVFMILIISNHATIYQANNSIQNLENQIENQRKVNSGLEEQMATLRNPERILKVAKSQGLSIKENNVEIIEE